MATKGAARGFKFLLCSFCSQKIRILNSRIGRTNFCNKSCYQIFNKKRRTFNCVVCGSEFYTNPLARKLGRKHCSAKCCGKTRSRFLSEYMKEYYKLKEKLDLLPNDNKMNKSNTTQSSLIKKLDIIFSIFIRQRDSNEDGNVICITCGRQYHWKMVDCGHYVPRNHKNTRFDEQNCHAQCRKCNRFQNGNMDEYALALQRKYGVSVLDTLSQRKSIIKQWTAQELEGLIEYYKTKIHD